MTTSSKASKNREGIAPHSKDSEMIVLGSMLTNINSLNTVAEVLSENDFYYLEHKIIFQVMLSIYREDKPVDLHLVSEELRRTDRLEAIGGVAFLISLVQFAGTSVHIEEYARLIKSKSILRQMIQVSTDIRIKAMEEPDDVTEALDEAQHAFFLISQKTDNQKGVLISDLLSGRINSKPYLDELESRQATFQEIGAGLQPKITGMPSHFIDLDLLVNGFSNSNLMILAARPAMGKTALAINIAENICLYENLSIGIFSLEMTAQQLLNRIICSQAG
ncbi:MAG: DnaB-like helicase N-terminal domain-containing protein, partial [Victivallaceae bacterium]